MKVFVAFFICIAAVFAVEERKPSEQEKRVLELWKESAKTCAREMNLDPRLVHDVERSTDSSLHQNACFLACLDKKMGVMNADGTYNYERILAYAETPNDKKKAEHVYNERFKECNSKVRKNDPCKMAACAHRIAEPENVKG